jgi:hypothetical protein
VRIDTDYSQWYDGIFDAEPPLFCRRAFDRGGLSKRAQFDLFTRLNLGTPPHGPISGLSTAIREGMEGLTARLCGQDQRVMRTPALAELRPPPALDLPAGEAGDQPGFLGFLGDLRCVVYLDEYAHQGDGKVLLPLAEAVERYPDHLGSLLVSSQGPPVIYRLARFGRWAFWLRQEGRSDDWRSNQRDSERLLAKVHCEEPNPIPRVLWAIDFVPSPFGLLALDFNTAPQLETVGEANALTAAEAAEELAAVARTFPEQLRQFP